MFKPSVNSNRIYRDQEEFLEETFDVDELSVMPIQCATCKRDSSLEQYIPVHRCHSNRNFICLGSIKK